MAPAAIHILARSVAAQVSTQDSGISQGIRSDWSAFSSFMSRPEIASLVIIWAVVFTIVMTVILTLGFGPAGIIPGTIAAAFQAWAYGGFTPAGGIFATLTSLAMLGLLLPAVTVVAAVIATVVDLIVWWVT